MTMRISLEDFMGTDEIPRPSFEEIASTMALDFEASVFCRLKELGLKQKDIAERLGVSAATISKTLSSNSNMTFKTAAKIAAALGCTIQSPILQPFSREEDTLPTTWQLPSTASEVSRRETYSQEHSAFGAKFDEEYKRLCAQNALNKTTRPATTTPTSARRLLGDAA